MIDAKSEAAARAHPPFRPFVFLVAGEPSGDVLGARLMAGLKRSTDGQVRFAGIGGPEMAAEGLQSHFPMSDLSLMGLVEVAQHLPKVWRRLTETVALVRELQPDVVVTIDAPTFNLRLCRRLRSSGSVLVHYVAPSVWAWRPGRAREIARFLDHLIALLPFEPPLFERHGLACTYVGHPVMESPFVGISRRSRREGRGPLLCVLPGSRRGEVAWHLPVFAETASRLGARYPDLRIAIPTVPAVARTVCEATARWAVPARVVVDLPAKLEVFATADVALAACGTVVLEAAAAGLPMIAAYKGNPLNAMIIRRMIRVRYVSLVNLLVDRPVIPELLQERCTPHLLAEAIERLVDDPQARDRQRAGFVEAFRCLAVEGKPSERAAAIVLGLARRGRRA